MTDKEDIQTDDIDFERANLLMTTIEACDRHGTGFAFLRRAAAEELRDLEKSVKERYQPSEEPSGDPVPLTTEVKSKGNPKVEHVVPPVGKRV